MIQNTSTTSKIIAINLLNWYYYLRRRKTNWGYIVFTLKLYFFYGFNALATSNHQTFFFLKIFTFSLLVSHFNVTRKMFLNVVSLLQTDAEPHLHTSVHRVARKPQKSDRIESLQREDKLWNFLLLLASGSLQGVSISETSLFEWKVIMHFKGGKKKGFLLRTTCPFSCYLKNWQREQRAVRPPGSSRRLLSSVSSVSRAESEEEEARRGRRLEVCRLSRGR